MTKFINISYFIVIVTLTFTFTTGDPGIINGPGPQRTFIYQLTERILLLQREFNLIMRQFERTILGLNQNQQKTTVNTAHTATKDVPVLPLVSPTGKQLRFQSDDNNKQQGIPTPFPPELMPGSAQHALSVLTSPIYSPIVTLSRLINNYFEQIMTALNFALSNRNLNETTRANLTG